MGTNHALEVLVPSPPAAPLPAAAASSAAAAPAEQTGDVGDIAEAPVKCHADIDSSRLYMQ